MTKVTLPPITFNYKFKTKKQARQEAIRVLGALIDDVELLGEIKVETSKKPCKNCPKNRCKNCPVKESK